MVNSLECDLNFQVLCGRKVNFKHYSLDTFIKGEVVNFESDNILSISPEDAYIVCSYFEDDPIVVSFEHENNVITLQTYIASIDYKNSKIKIQIEKIENFTNRREKLRYPASIYATLVSPYEMETSYISNLSENGLSMLSNTNLTEGQEIEIETNYKNLFYRIKTKVIWLRNLPTINEYGLKIIESEPCMSEIIKDIEKELIDSVKQMPKL